MAQAAPAALPVNRTMGSGSIRGGGENFLHNAIAVIFAHLDAPHPKDVADGCAGNKDGDSVKASYAVAVICNIRNGKGNDCLLYTSRCV